MSTQKKQELKAKRAYVTPKLTTYGNLQSITTRAQSGFVDGTGTRNAS
jgi:hypothetical protein